MTNQFTTYAHVVISQKLIEHVRSLYFLSVAQFLGNTDGQIETLNVASDHALPAYVSAVAAVEAYVNEFLISGAGIDFGGQARMFLSSFSEITEADVKTAFQRDVSKSLQAMLLLCTGSQNHQLLVDLCAIRTTRVSEFA